METPAESSAITAPLRRPAGAHGAPESADIPADVNRIPPDSLAELSTPCPHPETMALYSNPKQARPGTISVHK
ncbi:hypothetical protein EYF80_024938 [Liparis tanakae]|uniref:Uncharacterized protein n=1 Tax=Liparis tanakae TaxID=230148 RepID=A0A4Z2HG49_9TELE|nr:hypothetical protein EYF80_024938 [Liparis tanakae]